MKKQGTFINHESETYDLASRIRSVLEISSINRWIIRVGLCYIRAMSKVQNIARGLKKPEYTIHIGSSTFLSTLENRILRDGFYYCVLMCKGVLLIFRKVMV